MFNKLLNKSHTLVVVSAFLALTACSDNVPNPPATEGVTNSDTQSVSKSLSESLDMIRKDLPMVVDDVTTLESIDSDGLTVIYDYTIKVSDLDDSERSKLESEIKTTNTRNVCENPETSEFLDMGVRYIYNYQDLDDISIRGFEVTKDICDNL